MNISMFKVPMIAGFLVKAKLLCIALVAALSVGIAWADENPDNKFALQRTTIGQPVDQPLTWNVVHKPNKVEIKKVEIKVESFKLVLRNLKTGGVVSKKNNCLKGVDNVISFSLSDENKPAIYAVKLQAFASSDCSGDILRETDEIIQILGPSTNETAPTFTPCNSKTTYDVIVVDGTSAGIGAAITAAREGLSTCLLESTSLLGGMFTNGIGSTDISFYGGSVGDLKRKFLSYGLMDELRRKVECMLSPPVDAEKGEKVECIYNKSSEANSQFLLKASQNNWKVQGLRYTPSVIRNALYEMLKEQQAKLSITFNSSFISKSSSNTALVKERDENGIYYYSITTTTGKYKGRYLIDATDSGDVAVALSKESNTFDENYCTKNLNEREFAKDDKKRQVTQDDVPTNIKVENIPTFCLRNPTQAYSFVMTLQQHNSQKDNWSYMKTLPPNCFVNVNDNDSEVFGIEGRYTNDFFTKKGNDWSVKSGLMGTNPVIFQVKHHTTSEVYSLDYAAKPEVKKVFVEKNLTIGAPVNKDEACSVKYKSCDEYPKGKECGYKRLGDELIDCNAHGVVGLPTGYAGKKDDIERIPVVDRYLNHTMCFLYRMQRHKDKKILPTDNNITVKGNQIGFTKNEDPLRGNFPARMYVREGRRINGLQTFTGKDVQKAYYVKNDAESIAKELDNEEKKNKFSAYMENFSVIDNGRPAPEELLDGKLYTGDWKLEHPKEKLRSSIAVTTYGMDSHSVNLDESGDGEIPPSHMNYVTGPGNVPFGVMVPRHLIDERILVPLAASSGTWGQSVLRMEPTRLNMGQAAALAISIANKNNILPRDLLEPEHAGLLFKLQKELIWKYDGKVFLYLDDKFHLNRLKENKDCRDLTECDKEEVLKYARQHMAAQFLGIWGIASGAKFKIASKANKKDSPYMFKVDDNLTRAEFAKMIVSAWNSLTGKRRLPAKWLKEKVLLKLDIEHECRGWARRYDKNSSAFIRVLCLNEDKDRENYCNNLPEFFEEKCDKGKCNEGKCENGKECEKPWEWVAEEAKKLCKSESIIISKQKFAKPKMEGPEPIVGGIKFLNKKGNPCKKYEYEKDCFGAASKITAGEAAKMIALAFGIPPIDDDWKCPEKLSFCKYAEKVVGNGIMPKEFFVDNKTINSFLNRGDAARAICNAYVFSEGWDDDGLCAKYN